MEYLNETVEFLRIKFGWSGVVLAIEGWSLAEETLGLRANIRYENKQASTCILLKSWTLSHLAVGLGLHVQKKWGQMDHRVYTTSFGLDST